LLIEKLINEFPTDKIVLATTINPLDDELEAIASFCKIKCYRGSENNVLNRFIEAAEENNFDTIIRVCADNPFLDILHIKRLIKEIETKKYDYVSFKTSNGLPTIKSHLGIFTEAVSLKALKKVRNLTDLTLYVEHVTNYIYENKDLFTLKFLELPTYMENTDSIRLTLDTEADFKLERELFRNACHLSTEELIISLKNNTELLVKMEHQINKNVK